MSRTAMSFGMFTRAGNSRVGQLVRDSASQKTLLAGLRALSYRRDFEEAGDVVVRDMALAAWHCIQFEVLKRELEGQRKGQQRRQRERLRQRERRERLRQRPKQRPKQKKGQRRPRSVFQRMWAGL